MYLLRLVCRHERLEDHCSPAKRKTESIESRFNRQHKTYAMVNDVHPQDQAGGTPTRYHARRKANAAPRSSIVEEMDAPECPGETMVGAFPVPGIQAHGAQIGETLFNERNGDGFGHSMDLSADGTVLAIGSPQSKDGAGRVSVYTLT